MSTAEPASPQRLGPIWLSPGIAPRNVLTFFYAAFFTIGLISGTLQPVVVSNKLRNVPDKALYNWDPGAHFGIYETDTFWMETPDQVTEGKAAEKRRP